MPAPADPVARGLTSTELAIAIEELRALEGATVLDAVALVGTGQHDDVLLVLQPDESEAKKEFLHIALGGVRARISDRFRIRNSSGSCVPCDSPLFRSCSNESRFS